MYFLQALLDLLYVPRCILCREKTDRQPAVCPACSTKILCVHDCCRKCGHPLKENQYDCPFCHRQAFAFREACAVSLYQGAFRTAIHRLKYGGHPELARPLGQLLAQQVRACGWPAFEAAVPVPLHPNRLRERGYDQSLLVAKTVAGGLRIPVRSLLVRERDTVSQTTLSAAERWENVFSAFSAAKIHEMPGCVLLIDDLLTTGATAHFAARTLLAAGVREVYLAVLGRP